MAWTAATSNTLVQAARAELINATKEFEKFTISNVASTIPSIDARLVTLQAAITALRA